MWNGLSEAKVHKLLSSHFYFNIMQEIKSDELQKSGNVTSTGESVQVCMRWGWFGCVAGGLGEVWGV